MKQNKCLRKKYYMDVRFRKVIQLILVVGGMFVFTASYKVAPAVQL